MVSRRGFLTGMLALGAAPAIVRAASLMPVVTPAGLIVPSGDVLTLDMIRATRDRLMQDRWTEPFYVAMDPANERDFGAICVMLGGTVVRLERLYG